MAIGADAYSELFATTLEKYESGLVDQVIQSHPALDLLFKGNTDPFEGRKHVIPIEGAEDNSTAFTDASGTFTPSVSSDVAGVAVYDVADPLVSHYRVKFKDLKMNSGKSAIINMLKTHANASMKGHGKKIAKALHNQVWNGAADERFAGQFNSLDMVVSDYAYDSSPDGIANTLAFKVGDIATHNEGAPDYAADAAHAYWQATRETIADTVDIRKALRTVRNKMVVAGADAPNIALAGLTVWEELEDTFDDKVRYTERDLGGGSELVIQEIKFDGMTIRLDPDAPVNRLYMLNTENWRFGVLDGEFMKPQERQQIQGTLDHVVPIASLLSVGTSQRRNNGLLIRTYA